VIQVKLSKDRLHAAVELSGAVPEEELRAALEEAGVVFGVLEARLKGALELAKREGGMPRPVVVAHGREPVPPRPAELDLEVDIGQRSGSIDAHSLQVDYRERSVACAIESGALIGSWRGPQAGESGRGVDGSEIPCPKLDQRDARYGAGISARPKPGETGTLELHSELDGVVRLDGKGELTVCELFPVAEDVNLEVGNIDVNGSVQVGGGIQAGFRVTARKDIRVARSIEDAVVEAGGVLDVGGGILGGGIQGGDLGHVRAGELVRASFAQNAKIECGGDVELGSSTRSLVRCSGMLLVEGGIGHLRGGEYFAGRGLRAKELGSAQGAKTRVEVGRDPLLVRKLALVGREISELRERARTLQLDIQRASPGTRDGSEAPAPSIAVERLLTAKVEVEASLGELQERQKEFEQRLTLVEEPTIRVETRVFFGVELRIGDARLVIETSRPGGVFRRDPETGGITSD